MAKDIILGYDVMTYNGEQPNCLNPKFLNTIFKASDFYFSDSLESGLSSTKNMGKYPATLNKLYKYKQF